MACIKQQESRLVLNNDPRGTHKLLIEYKAYSYSRKMGDTINHKR